MRTLLSCGLLSLVILGAPSVARAHQDLAPPPPMDPNAPQPPPAQPGMPGQPGQPYDPNNPNGANGTNGEQATKQKLDEAEREDSGRNFEIFYTDIFLGGSYIDMAAFDSTSLGIKNTSSGGPMFALGAGFRLVVLTLGARMKYNALSAFNLWQLNLELGFKIPIDKVDILIGGHGGYSFVGSLGDAGQIGNTNTPSVNDAVSIRGFNAGLDLGFDYYITPLFSLGAGFFGDFLYLNRPPLELPADTPAEVRAQIEADPTYQQSGTTAGMQLGGALRVGLHFGL
ncbi:MAG: hypothetical protein JST00_21620 [Deltaproteobacteria bacterium]|nr:hypothetical protein [Deltaproteobacteria bacterium]